MRPTDSSVPSDDHPDLPRDPEAVAAYVRRRVREVEDEMAAVRSERRTPVRELLAAIAPDAEQRRDLVEIFESGRSTRELWASGPFRDAALAYAARRSAAVREVAER